MKNLRKPLLHGQVYCASLDGWEISWESQGNYRHWCQQTFDYRWPSLLVVMFNPGSLSGEGEKLSRDTTARVLREVCSRAKLNPFMVNLFDYAAPSVGQLFDNWALRDADNLVYPKLPKRKLAGYIMAYGDLANHTEYQAAIERRIIEIKNTLARVRQIKGPTNLSGRPKHPLVWQRQKLKSLVSERLMQLH